MAFFAGRDACSRYTRFSMSCLFFEIPCQQESLDAHKFLLTLTRQCQNVWTLSSHLWKYNHQSRGRVIIDFEYLAAHLSRSKANLRACVIIVSCVWHACNLVPKQFEQKTQTPTHTFKERIFGGVLQERRRLYGKIYIMRFEQRARIIIGRSKCNRLIRPRDWDWDVCQRISAAVKQFYQSQICALLLNCWLHSHAI